MKVLVIVLFCFLIVEIIILKKKRNIKPDGLLNVDVRDPKKDYYDFVFLIPTDDIPKKKYLTIEVFVKDEKSQG